MEVESDRGKIITRSLIYATHVPPGVNLLHFRCAPYRSYAMAVTLRDKNYPGGLAYDMYDPYHYYRTQEIDGERFLIAGGEDHKTAHEENTEACFTKLESYLRKYFNIEEILLNGHPSISRRLMDYHTSGIYPVVLTPFSWPPAMVAMASRIAM